ERVFLPGFGTFAPVARAARKGRNPKTGEELSLPACNAIKFTAAKRLKGALNAKK
ncbi:HU family DNA-binding protein, partial [Bilophila wadsworthia]